MEFCVFSICTEELACGVGGAVETCCFSTRTGGAAKVGTVCLVQTDGAINDNGDLNCGAINDWLSWMEFSVFSICTEELACGVGGAVETCCSSTRTGGTAKVGTVCLIQTDGAINDNGDLNCGAINDWLSWMEFPVFSICTEELACGVGGAVETGCSPTRTGGAAKTGTVCLIQTDGAINDNGDLNGGDWLGGGSGGVEKTGIAFLIVTGGAIPRCALRCRTGM
ncbi:unnamed protein product [Camellia sinensis]